MYVVYTSYIGVYGCIDWVVFQFSVAKDVYYDKQAAEADQRKEEAVSKHPKQSECFDKNTVSCVL